MRAPFPPEPGVNRSILKFKSVVDPSRVNAVVTPHVVELENGFIGAYTEDGALISVGADRSEHAFGGSLRMNHYFTKSKEELERKLARGSGAGTPMKDRLDIVAKRIGFVEKDLVEDKIIQRFLPDLRRAIDRREKNKSRVVPTLSELRHHRPRADRPKRLPLINLPLIANLCSVCRPRET